MKKVNAGDIVNGQTEIMGGLKNTDKVITNPESIISKLLFNYMKNLIAKIKNPKVLRAMLGCNRINFFNRRIYWLSNF